MTPSPAEKKGLSPDARKLIGVGALLACLLVGAGIIYVFLFAASPRQRTVKVDPKQQSIGVEGRLPDDVSPRDLPGVHRLNPSRWQVSAKTGMMSVTKAKDGYQFAYGFGRGFMTPDQVALLSSIIRAQTDTAMAQSWGLSDDQVAAIKKVNVRQSWLDPSKEDRAALAALWDAYVKAGTPRGTSEPGKRLIDKLDAVARANVDAGRAALNARLAEAKGILTADQVKKLGGR
jgi:hypothetical protein